MARPRNTVPTYQLHHQTGRARVRVYDSSGKRNEYILPGDHGSQESLDAYAKLLAQLKVGGGIVHGTNPPLDISVAELVERYLSEHVAGHHRGTNGKPTSEQASIVNAVTPLVRLFASKLASDITPLDLRAYRDVLISGKWRTIEEGERRQRSGKKGPPCRRTVNAHVGRTRRMFKWAVSLCLVPPHVLAALNALPGLQPGRSAAKDRPPIEAVPLDVVERTIQHAPEMVGDVIRVQLYCGCRASELLNARTKDILFDGPADCWILKPEQHKGKWRGHDRTIVFGPKSQLVLRRYLTPSEPERFLFRPCDSAYAKARPRSKFRDHYSVDVFDIAIARAAERAGVPHWSSHALRHLAARIAEREIGLESARQFLGHKGADLTALYSGLDTNAAAEVAKRIG